MVEPKGQTTLENVSKPRKFWRIYGEASLWVCWLSMAVIALLLVVAVYSAFTVDSSEPAPSPSELVAIRELIQLFR